jgi:hypothetical protein
MVSACCFSEDRHDTTADASIRGAGTVNEVANEARVEAE